MREVADGQHNPVFKLAHNPNAVMGSLSNLTYLHLSNNALSGCVPSSLEDRLNFYYSDLGDLPFC